MFLKTRDCDADQLFLPQVFFFGSGPISNLRSNHLPCALIRVDAY